MTSQRDIPTLQQAEPTEPLHSISFGKAIKDFGWISSILVFFVGGPSILSLVDSFLVELDLTPFFQWVMLSYQRIAHLLQLALGPSFDLLLNYFNNLFNLNLKLYPHWKPVFLLSLIWWSALIRLTIEYGSYTFGVFLSKLVMLLGVVVGAFIAGLVPSNADRWLQGLLAGVPIAAMLFFAGLSTVAEDLRNFRKFTTWLTAAFSFFGVAFIVSLILSLIPGLANSSGILVVGGLIFWLGVHLIGHGFELSSVDHVRVGITVLGGFVSAALILIADFAVKSL